MAQGQKNPWVACPACGQNTHPKGKCCMHCGQAMPQPANPPVGVNPAPATPPVPAPQPAAAASAQPSKKEEKEEQGWRIEVTSSGANGIYQLRVQAVKDGQGEEAEIWVGGLNLVQVIDPQTGQLIGSGQAMLVSDAVQMQNGLESVEKMKTDKKGFLYLETEFEMKSVKLVFAIAGTDKDTGGRPMILSGPPYQRPQGASFLEAIRARKAYNRGQ